MKTTKYQRLDVHQLLNDKGDSAAEPVGELIVDGAGDATRFSRREMVPSAGDSERHPVSMRVVISDSTKHFGGAFELALTLVEHLNQLQPDAAVLISSQPAAFLKSRVPDTVPALGFACNHWGQQDVPRFAIPWHFAKQLARRELPGAIRFARLIREQRATVVHLNGGVSQQLYGLLACRLTGVRCVVSYQIYEYPSRLIKPLRKYVDRFIAPSTSIARYAIDVLGIPESKVVKIFNPIDTENFAPKVPPVDLNKLFGIQPGRKVFSIFGRLTPWKGHVEFLKAAQLVLKRVPEAHAMIVGDPADADPKYGETLRRLSRELEIADRTTFTGYRSDIAPLMRSTQVIVHASIEPEPFGLVVAEGMACGRPCVAMDDGGPPDMIDSGTHGLLVRPNEPEGLANAISTLLENPELAAAIGSAARLRCVERFSAQTIAEHHMNLYRELSKPRTDSRGLGASN